MVWFFGFFFVSGFCSLMCEVIWLRLAMAQFGVTTPMISLVLSSFMLGLGVGSWGGGYLIRTWGANSAFPALRLYALTEFLIGCSAFVVLFELSVGRHLLNRLEAHHGLSSLAYYCCAGTWIAISLVPWSACMGATFPCALFAIKRDFHSTSTHSFSYLYLANVLGAMAGAVLPLFLIEEVGFSKALLLGASLNFLLALCALVLASAGARNLQNPQQRRARPDSGPLPPVPGGKRLLLLLFGTGLTSMAAEVVWVRMFTAWLGTVVYAFAAILAIYLAATYMGSLIYRTRIGWVPQGGSVWAILGITLLIPLLASDPRIPIPGLARVFVGIVPLSFVSGLITPCLLDLTSSGDPGAAGSAYGWNVVGCIVGPLVSGFILLPRVGERGSLVVLALFWFTVSLVNVLPLLPETLEARFGDRVTFGTLVVLSVVLISLTKGFESQFSRGKVRRDASATVIATGDSREGKRLLVNGIGITNLTPETKLMAHLPLAFLGRQASNALDICFGMGTTHRSLLSWGISSTAVELVPSVPSLYGYFHADGPGLLASPRSHLVIDDGRSYLERSNEDFDVITIDPPPPVEAAGSSLLYSKEFYATARQHLSGDGILQQWIPNGDAATVASIAKSIQQSFPYVRAFRAIEGQGIHFLASPSPIRSESPSILASRLPAPAATDLLEWGPFHTAEEYFAAVLKQEVSLETVIRLDPQAPALQDDRPVNEYFLLRRLRSRAFLKQAWQKLLAVPD